MAVQHAVWSKTSKKVYLLKQRMWRVKYRKRNPLPLRTASANCTRTHCWHLAVARYAKRASSSLLHAPQRVSWTAPAPRLRGR